jgi:hypothetical protein
MRRPASYSESDIRLPRIPTVQRPILQEGSLTSGSPQKRLHSYASLFELGELPANSDPTPTPFLQDPVTIETAPRIRRICGEIGHWTFRFLMHLTLISLFESVFFWFFVSRSEDAALVGLVNQYLDVVVQYCQGLEPSDRATLLTYLNAVINRSVVDADGVAAGLLRSDFNSSLQARSSFYCLMLLALTCLTGGALRVCHIPVRLMHVIGENLALVAFLGAYEAIFFTTVAFRYRPITAAELDALMVDQVFDALG